MADEQKKASKRRPKVVIAFEKVEHALRNLNNRTYYGPYGSEGGQEEVRNLLAYFNQKYGA